MPNRGADTDRLRELDIRHHLHPFTTFKELARTGSRIITGAQGSHLIDSEGNRILDGMAGLWCVNVGYGRERLARAAYDQMRELAYYNTFFQSATPPAIELAARLATLLPEGMNRVFYASSGSEANDTAIKSIWYYWNLMERPEKKIIISRTLAYHGVGLGSGSLSGMAFMHEPFDLPLGRFVHIGNPYHFAEGGDLDPAEFGRVAASWLEEKILEIGPERIAAFFGEPIQGAGGVIIPPDTYWPEIQRICRKYEVLLVADEVICGFGRTGRTWGSETFGIQPDILTMAKGLSSGYQPIAAVAFADRVGDVLFEADREFAHGVTYAGHPVACRVALENIAIMEEEGLFERASGPAGRHFAERLQALADHPLIGEVRTCGFLAAMEIVEDKEKRRPYPAERKVGLACREISIRNGLVMRAIRDAMVLAPPLTITEAEIDEMADKARASLDELAHTLDR